MTHSTHPDGAASTALEDVSFQPKQIIQKPIVLITGATGAIGRELADYLIQKGMKLILTGQSEVKLSRLRDSLKQVLEAQNLNESDAPLYVPFDLTKGDQIDLLGARLYEEFGRIDGFVSCTGFLKELGPVAHFNRAHFDKTMMVNFGANFRLLQNLHLLFQGSTNPRAVFMTSTENRDDAYWGIYQASKAALETMVISYAKENARSTSIKANLFDPYRVSSTLRGQAFPGEPEGAFTLTAEAKEKIAYLLSRDCDMSGEVVKLSTETEAR
ncbi:MAG: SDR family NAD(P)-dependent oxidoreductase [Alphaproteobacteria bacterium]|nr:SDR family NAD(P)-dependent oxidoreductase [Alphaproteobacteria bacterium]MBP9877609.1 SDR family NAD(P)-dependent oxidoreductase [Alphaproteobacteria bacterium]